MYHAPEEQSRCTPEELSRATWPSIPCSHAPWRMRRASARQRYCDKSIAPKIRRRKADSPAVISTSQVMFRLLLSHRWYTPESNMGVAPTIGAGKTLEPFLRSGVVHVQHVYMCTGRVGVLLIPRPHPIEWTHRHDFVIRIIVVVSQKQTRHTLFNCTRIRLLGVP